MLKRSVIASFMMLAAYGCLYFISQGEPVPPKRPLSAYPKQIGGWLGNLESFSKEIYDAVGVDDSALVSYTNADGDSIQLYIGYYSSQREGDLIHSPRNCMPGSGWEIIDSSILEIPNGKNGSIETVQLEIEKLAEKQIVIYWFQSRGRYISSEYMQKIYLVWDAVFRNRTDGAFVRLISPVGKKGKEHTVGSLKDFASKLLPVNEKFLPE